MALSAAVPAGWSQIQTYFAITLILSLIGWTWLARQLRGLVLSLRQSDYVMAAKLAGASDARIIFKHLIPATIGQIIVVATLSLPAMILAETALSFLGLGLAPADDQLGRAASGSAESAIAGALSLGILACNCDRHRHSGVQLSGRWSARRSRPLHDLRRTCSLKISLKSNDLEVHFRTLDGIVRGIDGVTLTSDSGETLGVVGEIGLRQKRNRPQHPAAAAQTGRVHSARGNLVSAAQR